ncbi:MAG: hypothetical protein QN178_01510 [Armatimonadota bacterium]|nr:hypothetical protein [Armatimonadota bacterium]
MDERQAVYMVLWALGAMVVVGALLPVLFPGFVRYVNRTILKETDDSAHGH